MAIGSNVKDKIGAFLGAVVLAVAVAAMLPTLQTGLNAVTGVPLLNFSLFGLLFAAGLILVILDLVV
jgi:hypothetical protein